MSISTSTIISNVLSDTNEGDGEGNITRVDVLRYLQEAQEEFNDITFILKGSAVLQGIAAQIEYDLPSNFKTNLFNVEYNYLSLVQKSKEFLDLYDSGWREPAHLADLALIPLYYINHLVPEGKFIIYPPPEDSGDSEAIRKVGGRFKRTITLDDTDFNLRAAGGGFVRTITSNSEVLELRTRGGGFVRRITPRKNNIFIEYIKNPDNLLLTGNIESDLEKYQKPLEDYCKYKIFLNPGRSESFNDAKKFFDLFEAKALQVREQIELSRPSHPQGFKPVYDRSGLSSKDIYLSA
jgi:hypothetical protein